MKNELLSARHKKPTTGKVIAELKFVFWEKMLTTRFDERIWNAHLFSVLPNLNPGWDIPTARNKIYDDLAHLRVLRNRIAHHEPIFNRTLTVDFQKIKEIITFRCHQTAGWMVQNQQAQAFFANKPL
jgi:hypothetical protein